MIRKIQGPEKAGREAMYHADRQDLAYQQGAYDYLDSIAMAPRMATIAAYIKARGVNQVLDVGCGPANLLSYLDPGVTYIGIDISPTAINTARERFQSRDNASFHVADFRNWECPIQDLDCVVWAGIGCTWTRKGSEGDYHDWSEILNLAEGPLQADGCLILELVTQHWPSIQQLIEGRYDYLTGCDIDCFQSDESPKRSIRVLKKTPTRPVSRAEIGEVAGWDPSKQKLLIELANQMGQATDERTANLGFGYIYYALTRLYQPDQIVCIGSYRGFSPVCFALGLRDNGRGRCYFIDPGKVDRYWHDPENVKGLEQTFGIRDYWQHLRQTSQKVIAEGQIHGPIGMLFIDGDHSYEGVKFDFEHFGAQVSEGGLILFHDSTAEGRGYTPWEVKRFLDSEVYGRAEFETFTLPFAAGLTIMKKLQP